MRRHVACSPWHVSALGRRDEVDAGPEWSATAAASWFMTAWVGFSMGMCRKGPAVPAVRFWSEGDAWG